DTHKSEIAHR
nr:RecName: Full=Serum albumin [Dama dama]